jgi:hypothetical protein
MLWKAVDFYVYLHECISLEMILTASDQSMPLVEQITSKKEN